MNTALSRFDADTDTLDTCRQILDLAGTGHHFNPDSASLATTGGVCLADVAERALALDDLELAGLLYAVGYSADCDDS